ncbi:hypothetical protein GW17_00013465 [Ensete ventricosum]|nr:hypothetical protein GW17_00013465 [Ensete ventricosum]
MRTRLRPEEVHGLKATKALVPGSGYSWTVQALAATAWGLTMGGHPYRLPLSLAATPVKSLAIIAAPLLTVFAANRSMNA